MSQNPNTFDADTIRDYLDRHLDAEAEQRFEEAMIADPELAEQVRAEQALRRGFRELALREKSQPGVATAVAASGPARQAWSRRRRWLSMAAAAALMVMALVPTVVLIQNRQDQADMEARIAARIEASGAQASYALPASLTMTEPDPTATEPAADEPVRIRLPEGVRDVVLELPTGDLATPRRMILQRQGDRYFRFASAGAPVEDAQALGFRMASDQVPPGRYQITVERASDAGWVTDRQFELTIDAPR
jgi:hypothetical protein